MAVERNHVNEHIDNQVQYRDVAPWKDIPTWIHSFRGPSYDKSTASSKANSSQSAIWRFLFQLCLTLPKGNLVTLVTNL